MSYCPSYNYSSLGCNCKSNTVALTSNEKYLYPTDNVYYDFFPLNTTYKNREGRKYKPILEQPRLELKSKCTSCNKQ
jgi:hypothetical protein